VRLVSAWALGEIKDERAINSLISTVEDEDPIVREMAVLALGEIEDSKAIDVLSGVFDQEEELRPAVIWALGEISGDEAEMAREAAFTVWRRSSWENDEVWTGRLDWGRIRRESARTGNVATLLNDLRSGSGERRRTAAFELGLLGINGDESAIQGIIPLLDTLRDPVPEVRAMVVWALDEINPSRWGDNYRSPYRIKF
jgi:HEAT repeat protein